MYVKKKKCKHDLKTRPELFSAFEIPKTTKRAPKGANVFTNRMGFEVVEYLQIRDMVKLMKKNRERKGKEKVRPEKRKLRERQIGESVNARNFYLEISELEILFFFFF